MRKGMLIILFLATVAAVYAQEVNPKSRVDTSKTAVLRVTRIGNDTLPLYDIHEIEIYPRPHFKNRRQYRRYSRYVRNVKKVYPFAKYLGNLMDVMEQHLDSLQTDQERRRYINGVEKDLKNKFEDDILNMTYSQGKILLKLINRETGKSSYAILDEMKGDFAASFWQTIARIFGTNLKMQFDPEGDDRILNQIVLMIESGRI
ncbi:MAG: DUF4294 domain-containing protein [Chlorobi bacterium]|nr:DUF4294 domain-containing protein [Chlorobiota bacterium]